VSGSFLGAPEVTPAVQELYAEDLSEDGYVWHATELWAHQPETVQSLFTLMSTAFHHSDLELRQRGILVAATASTLGDSYCSLAWGGKLSGFADPDLAAGVLTGSDLELTDQERAMAVWARKVVADPNGTTASDVQELRDAGLTDQQIFAITVFVSLRLAFSTVNDALGASPDRKWVEKLPAQVVAAVDFGRSPTD
jgi:alkylhydroperoxidase family enzyme